MKSKKIQNIIFWFIIALFFLYIFNLLNQNTDKNEMIFLKQVEFNNKKISVTEERVTMESGLRENKLKVNDMVIETFLPAGYYSTNISDTFIFSSDTLSTDYLIVLTSWNSENIALGISGVFYEVHIFNSNFERMIDVEDAFYDSVTDEDKEEANNIRGSKGAVIQKLKELEKQGKI